VKFGTTEGTAVPNFMLICEYLGVSDPKKLKNCQNCQLFRPAQANSLPDVGEIHRVYGVIHLQMLLTFGAI